MVNILLVDDHQLVRKGLKALLDTHPGFRVVAEAGTGLEALQMLDKLKPDLMLLDIMMPDGSGLELAADILRRDCPPKIVLLTMCSFADNISAAIKTGIQGYVVKDTAPNELFNAINTVMRGEIYLSPAVSKQILTLLQTPARTEARISNLTNRQTQILKLIALGYSSKAMADELRLSIKTIEAHRSQLMQRLGIREVAGLVRYAMRTGLIED